MFDFIIYLFLYFYSIHNNLSMCTIFLFYFNIVDDETGDEVWAITGHRVVDFKIGEIILNDGRIFYGPSDFMFMDSSDKEGIEEKYLFKSKEELIKSL